MKSYTLSAADRDAIPDGKMIPHLQSAGVPVTARGVYLPNFAWAESKIKDGVSTWSWHWHEGVE